MPNGETVLVFGGAGYVGSHACRALAEAGYTPVVYDNLQAGHAHAVQWGPLVRADIRDQAAVTAAARAHAPVAAMHFAANIEVGEGERSPATFYDNNVAGVLSLVAGLRAAGVEALVFSSTCAIYGPPQSLPLREDHPIAPASVYGRTKAMVEAILADFEAAYGFRSARLRYFNASGASRDGLLGEEHDPETHLIPNVLKAAAGLGEGLTVFGDDYDTPDGTCVRDYVHVEDLGTAHVAALERLVGGAPGFAANLGTGRGVTVRQVIDTVARVTGRTPPHRTGPRRPGDVPVLYADPAAARALLDWTPTRSDLDAIVESAWRFHQRSWGLTAAAGEARD